MVRLKNRYLLVNILSPTSAENAPPTFRSIPAPTTPSLHDALPEVIQFHRPCPDTLTAQGLTKTIKGQMALLYGDYGVGAIAASLQGTTLPCSNVFSVKYISPITSTFILRVSRAHYRLVWAALSFLTDLPGLGRPCVLQVVRVSGTIRKVEEEAIRRARMLVLKAKKAEVTGPLLQADECMEDVMVQGVSGVDDSSDHDDHMDDEADSNP
ncbi:MAG: hypothetical protein M1817_005490 [Caeruleum heppii]|nr:MAG: hypothetical protein M1817_005490 [Caeruleum heppii]